MSRRQWTGLAGVLFGALMLAGIVTSGTTPESTAGEAAQRYTDYWSDSGNQDRAWLGSFLLTYACVLLTCFAAGLRTVLRRRDDGPLPNLVLTAGAAAAALLGAGSALVNAPGIAASENAYAAEGNEALLLEAVGYYVLTTGIMCAAAMVLATALSNRVARVLPGWLLVLAGLVALVGVGSIFTAWLGFLLVPAWAVVTGVCLLVQRDRVPDDDRVVERSAAPVA